MDTKNKNILIIGSFSIRDWELLKQRQQTIVEFLVKDFNVFYIERISAKNVGIIKMLKAFIKRFFLVRNVGGKGRFTMKHLCFIQLKIFPLQRGIFRFLNAKLALLQIRKIMKKYKINHFDSVIISHPANYVNDIFDKIPAVKRIYDCVQRFEFNKYFPPEVVFNDKNIAKKVDLVIADSITIFSEKLELNKNVVRIPQGIDIGNYNINRIKDVGIPGDLANMGNNRICYIGSFHQTFDFDLVRKLAVDIPAATVILIGSETSEAKKKLDCNNIVFLGWKHFKQLPIYMDCMDLFIIPYALSEHGKGVFPTKLFEYLYFKKPIVSTALPDILEYEKYLYVAHTGEEFIKFVQDSLFKGENKLSAIPDDQFKHFISENSWEARYIEFKKYL
ncbi:glycosyltransferase [Candidatus Kuenenia stuttgartiensis]|jgi:glycosyltransferase involved in cell wall biosynthesis|uniref:Teichuronic acid biosynthesis glycosyltransferase TuaH n=1 Tax=Kuenenia stuttgartiensis TaxID=174633 RepID=A0A2C9CBW2_KUEST|nr:glycosyltransferase [Candidatus Kuenenia stuttgartiensis]MCL4279340.1 glycosyltransferase [Ignavibacteriaceae bacterium]SOH03063.1 Putative teichuronic acid biosynthesis glycosyltransferase TuaH [Candidatus Kuenenia stuttgartiensis]